MKRAAAIAAVLLFVPGAAVATGAGFDNPTSGDTSQQFTPPPNTQTQDKPNDPDYDSAEPGGNAPTSTNLFDERFDLFGFPSSKTAATAHYLDPSDPHVGLPQVSGYNAAGAWKLTRGRPDVTVAILDTGIRWDKESLRKRIRLNTGELPKPEAADGTPAATYDLNTDGTVNVVDYKDDPRVTTHSGPGGTITGEDLIHAFSDGTDADGNGYKDDIAGWDFFDDDNDPLDASSYFAAGNHGSGRASDAAEEGNDGQGSIGVCPKCQIVPLRVWDTFVADANNFALATLYATDNGVQVIEGADGGLYHSAFSERASQYAYDHGAVQTFSGDDLNTANHNFPANYSHAMLIQGTVPDTVGLGQNCSGSTQFCTFFNTLGINSGAQVGTYFRGANTTQFGGKSSISMEGATGSINTGRASGGAGLVVSAAKDNGVTLEPDETREILEQTAEDVRQGNTGGTGNPDPANPGWDSHFGWGRANLGAAVSVAADSAKIPDRASIDSPDWYAPLTGASLDVKGVVDARFTGGHQLKYKLEWGVGQAPTSWTTVTDTPVPVTGSDQVRSLGTINLNDVRTAVAANTVPDDTGGPVFAPGSKSPFQREFTVRLTVTDPTNGSTRIAGVDRRVLNALDPVAEGLRPGFPKRLGTGGEAPIRYADLNGDNVQELIVPAEDGQVHAYEPDGSELPGWPVKTGIQFTATGHLDAPGVKSIVDGGAPPREPPRGPAVADIDGDGEPEVIDTAGTHVYVWEGDGSVRPGFPVSSRFSFCGAQFEHQDDQHLKCGFLASPSVADLDGDGKRTDIVVASLDGHVYAFRPDGSDAPNFPVQLVDPVQKAANHAVLAESINEVAVGDLNGVAGDEIVAGTNETYGTTPSNGQDVSFGGLLGAAGGKSTRVYALDGKSGAILDGWPVSIGGLIPDVLPLIGPGADPALMKVNGTQKVIASATSGPLSTYDTNGSGGTTTTMHQEQHAGNATDRSPAINLFESAAVGKLLAGGSPSIVKYEVTLSQAANLLLVGQNFPYHHLIGAWDPSSGATQPGYPTVTDDYQFLSSSTIAKVDPGAPLTNQVLAGNGLGLLHAYDGATGVDAPGFPKTTGGWLFAPAALSDDGRMAGITREGYLFEWSSTAAACQTEWPTFRHDPQNSGNYDRDGTPPAAPGDASLTSLGGDQYKLEFKSPGDDGFCGSATSYRVNGVDSLATKSGGEAGSLTLTLSAGSVLRFQAVDEEGNVGQPVELVVPVAAPGSGGGGDAGGNNAGNGGGGGNNGGGGNGGGGNPGPGPKGCAAGATVPRSSISRRHHTLKRRRLHLEGRAIVVDCVTGKLATGKVRRVRVSVARRQHGNRCRYLKPGGHLAKARRCGRPSYLSARVGSKRGARNKTLWSLTKRVHLPRGRYVATVRGIDVSGRRETASRPTNTLTFRLR